MSPSNSLRIFCTEESVYSFEYADT
jgi:hypothetical protein